MPVDTLSNIDMSQGKHEDKLFSILFNEDELTWQTIIYDLVKTEAMDPWDVSIGVIAERFISMLKKMKEFDFRISGKMILAAALLLKIKSERLMKEDILLLDNIINEADEPTEFLDELADFAGVFTNPQDQAKLTPRTPQPRQRKVSVYDLVEALEKALNTETKKQWKSSTKDPVVQAPKKGKDVSFLINEVYQKVRTNMAGTTTISFDSLIPSLSKEDKVYTFIPLLHLDTQRKIDLLQKEHFGEILVKLNNYTFKT